MQTEEEDYKAKVDLLTDKVGALSAIRARIEKVDKVLAKLPSMPRAKQTTTLAQARRFLLGRQTDRLPVGTTKILGRVVNEVTSLRNGVILNSLRPKDLVLTTTQAATEELSAMLRKTRLARSKLTSAIFNQEDVTDESRRVLQNAREQDKIPPFNGKEFVLARVPIAFTFANKKQASVGFLQKDVLTRLGFKSDNVDGYTILHNQLVVGVDPAATYNRSLDVEHNQVIMEKKRTKERVLTYKGGRPTFVEKNTDMKPIQIAERVCDLITKKTGSRYTFMSEFSYGYKGATFFWLIKDRDYNLLQRAFPGSTKINKWGFAF